MASLLSGLAKYRDAFVIDVIDSLLENIQAWRCGVQLVLAGELVQPQVTLERNDFREMPLRV